MSWWRALVSLTATLLTVAGCNPCERAHGDATRAWTDIAATARDVAAWWGRVEVEEGAKGRYGVPEEAAAEREKWLKAERLALDASTAVRTSAGRARPAEVVKAVDELTNLKPPRPFADWPARLRTARQAADQMVGACRAGR